MRRTVFKGGFGVCEEVCLETRGLIVGDKLFRDPLYNYVNIDRSYDEWLLGLIDCPEVQRLRRVHQLGVSHFTYPGAEHNRLAHSMGVLYLMSKAHRHLSQSVDQTRRQHVDAARPSLLAAALLHDVGHGPFSHLFEPCMGIDHEYWTVRILSDPDSCVYKKLVKVDEGLPQDVCDLIEGTKPTLPRWKKSLISSQLDVDRMDYLRRDSLFSGAGYGHFDWSRIITSVELHESDNSASADLVWPERAAMAIEEYIFARYYMYQNVYLHKTTRGFEIVLQAMWRRAKELIELGKKPILLKEIEQLWLSDANALSVQDYLAVEEHSVLYQMQLWESETDSVLSDLASRFLNRDGFAMVRPPVPENQLTEDLRPWEEKVRKILIANGFDNPDYYCLKDELKAKYLTPYRPEPEQEQQDQTNAIFVKQDSGVVLEVSEFMPRLKAVVDMARPSNTTRYYVPKAVREEVQALVRG